MMIFIFVVVGNFYKTLIDMPQILFIAGSYPAEISWIQSRTGKYFPSIRKYNRLCQGKGKSFPEARREEHHRSIIYTSRRLNIFVQSKNQNIKTFI